MSTTAPQAARQAPVAGTPVGTVHVFDPHPLNWLFITWNTMEEPVRTDHEGHIVLALAEEAVWREDGSFAVTVRAGARFQDGESCTAHSIKQNFDEVQKWAAPHPPGTYLNFHPAAECVVEGDRTCVFRLPEPDGPGHGQVPRLSHRQPVVLADARVRLQEDGERRGPLVSDRRTGPVGHRTVHPRRGLLDDRHPDGHPAGPPRIRRDEPDHD
jgi:hypothetical protein